MTVYDDPELTFEEVLHYFHNSIPVHEMGYALRAYIRHNKDYSEASLTCGVPVGEFRVDLSRDYRRMQIAIDRGMSLWGV